MEPDIGLVSYTNILHGGLAALNNFDFIKAKHLCNYENNIPVFHNYTVDIKLQYITDFLVKELLVSKYTCIFAKIQYMKY